MIKSIKVRTSNNLDEAHLVFIQRHRHKKVEDNKNETIALSTTLIENTLLSDDDWVQQKFTYRQDEKTNKDTGFPTEVTHSINILIIDQNAKLDLIKVLKEGDVAAKKRLLKQLEEL